ncbi:TPA: hypothetical protein JG889_004302 [Enterobacter hormaechei subsp. steigerwaltii]|uniref:hypothetical protein n=1 Tax=Enterobacter cloacae complex TaxID=354276 RepID=UPI000AE86716|nr:hypothetical protein [Enterobacter hormaechei]HAV1695164.1 hypothetical protein [Enterobacter hormaechei subsp. steigerwaltii]HAV1877602.1 hypothetical protein [Enterobacter hormaechei subsp. steigerwaltii]
MANSEDAGTDVFDFNSMRPSINKIKNKLSSMDIRRTSNMLRCDKPSKININNYQQLVREDKNIKAL